MTYLRESLSRYFFQLLKGKNPPPPLIPPKTPVDHQCNHPWKGEHGPTPPLPINAHIILFIFLKHILIVTIHHIVVVPGPSSPGITGV